MPVGVAGCGSLVGNSTGWRCTCKGFPAISQGQTVDWTWPWKIKALHAVGGSSSPAKARIAA